MKLNDRRLEIIEAALKFYMKWKDNYIVSPKHTMDHADEEVEALIVLVGAERIMVREGYVEDDDIPF